MLKNKNILFVVPSMNSGGVEIGILEIAKKNYETKDFNMFLLTSQESKLVRKLRNFNVNVLEIDVKTKNPFKIIKNISNIKKIIIENNIDLVQVESRAPAWSCYFACKKLNIPFITVVQFGLCKPTSFLKKKYNSIMFKGGPIITVANFMKDYALQHYGKYITNNKKINKEFYVVYRGIDTEVYNQKKISLNRILLLQEELKLPDDNMIIILPARFTKQKGQDYFLRVLTKLKYKNYCCLMVGDTKKKPGFVKKIEKFIYKNNLENHVKICDNVIDMPALYFLSNIVVSSSVKTPESFGRISIEAQSMERIFVGTAMGGTLETVIDGKTGFLVPSDNENKFAQILDDILIMSEEKRNEITAGARNNILNNFTFDIMYNKMLNIYNKIFEK